jgi:hypothetical protein
VTNLCFTIPCDNKEAMSTGQTFLQYSNGLAVQHNFIEYNTNGKEETFVLFHVSRNQVSQNEFSVSFVIESSSHVSFKAGAAVFHKIFFSYYLQRNKTLPESYKSYTCTMTTNFLH